MFLTRKRIATAPAAFTVVIADLRTFLMPLVVASKNRCWRPGAPWSAETTVDDS